MAGIGDLVTNLTVNAEPFKKGLSAAQSGLRSFAGGIGSIVAPIAGALGALWGAGESISGFKSAIEVQRRFQSVLDATGNSAGITLDQMNSLADGLQQVTNFDGDDTIAAGAVIASLGNVNGDNFNRTIALAQDLATVMGTSLDSAVKKVGKSLKDLSPEEVTAKLDEMQARFGGAARAVNDPISQLKVALGDVAENIGAVLTPSIDVLATSLTSMLGVVAGGGDWFKSMGIEAAVVLSNMGGLLTIAVMQWELFFVQAALGAAHLFTQTIPAYLTWFGTNWSTVLLTAVDYAATVFINLGENIRNVWQSVLDFISTGKFEFNWKPLTEGFKNSIADLPDVPKRLTTEFETALQSDIASMTQSVGEEMNKQRTVLEQKFSVTPKMRAQSPTYDPTEATPAAAKESKPSEFKAAFKGSQEAASIALRGSSGSKLETLAKQQLEETKKQTKAIEASNGDGELVADFGAV